MNNDHTKQPRGQKKLISTSACADYLGLTVNQVRRLANDRELPHYRFSRRTWKFRPAELDRWLEEKKAGPLECIHG